MTLEEAFSVSKLDVSHLKAFSCSVYIHVPKDKISKLKSSGRKGILVGYSEWERHDWRRQD